MSKYEAIIGLEVHAQLLTDTKIFCGCRAAYGDEANTNVCPVCLGMPGTLPVLNKKVIDMALKAALALDCKINRENIFARKNYFYPDLPKGYQISEFDKPLAEHGKIEFELSEGNVKSVRITRIHIEEDAGKNLHEGFSDSDKFSYVDMNRCGIPLIEIVSEPDIRSAEEAAAYLQELRKILRYLGICDGNMEQGSLRCDANLSLRPFGQEEFGTKTEVKNMNSFRSVRNAIDYEIERQTKMLENGERIEQETRLWNQSQSMTISMRSKEESHDYRYFPEPDLVPLNVENEFVTAAQSSMTELPQEKKYRLINDYNIPWYNASVLTETSALADYFEEACKSGGEAVQISNWILNELLRELNEDKTEIDNCRIKPAQLSSLVQLIEDKTISGKIAKSVFEEMYKSGKDPRVIVDEQGLGQISDQSELKDIVEKIIKDNPDQVQKYREGKAQLLGFFVGQVMKETEGKANPGMVNKLLKELLK
ncbi:MAG: Asp-tRNA(Asn)/Glu-tRNA(Gln) amidotransferase subunit GatB [Acidobacteria bacterium]|nr:Asp-tRNA(Asn)/Glu-tRNA(Gln) amidotransferase subunit GatB [Acidobacteriota bacterium]